MTPQQQRLLDYVREYFDRSGLTPTYEEMADHLGLASKSGIKRLIEALDEQGLLLFTPKKTRSLQLPMPNLTAVPTSVLEAEIARRERREQRA